MKISPGREEELRFFSMNRSSIRFEKLFVPLHDEAYA